MPRLCLARMGHTKLPALLETEVNGRADAIVTFKSRYRSDLELTCCRRRDRESVARPQQSAGFVIGLCSVIFNRFIAASVVFL